MGDSSSNPPPCEASGRKGLASMALLRGGSSKCDVDHIVRFCRNIRSHLCPSDELESAAFSDCPRLPYLAGSTPLKLNPVRSPPPRMRLARGGKDFYPRSSMGRLNSERPGEPRRRGGFDPPCPRALLGKGGVSLAALGDRALWLSNLVAFNACESDVPEAEHRTMDQETTPFR
jgi:hypothetical protein